MVGRLLFVLSKGLKYALRHGPREQRLQLFLAEVGGIYIKLGQIMAMRVEVLPDRYIQELQKLLDDVPPFESETAREIIAAELGGPVVDLYETFNDVPLAAASFGQVHCATLAGGDAVVVKVQRPGIERVVQADLRLLRIVAFLIDATGLTRRTPLTEVYQELKEWTHEELDYRIEGSHAQELHDKATGSVTEKIPAVYWERTSRRVLTLERLSGLWVKEIMARHHSDPDGLCRTLADQGTDLVQISRTLLHNTLSQIFVYGVYHADPHAANLLVRKNGVIGYVDFGITGRIGDRSKDAQVRIHVALESGDADRFFAAVISTLDLPRDADVAGFEHALKKNYTEWLSAQNMRGTNIKDKSFARLMLRINFAAQSAGVGFRTPEVRIFRALATIDAVLLQFAPALDMRPELRSFFEAYRSTKFLSSDLPRLIHSLPDVVSAAADSLDPVLAHGIARLRIDYFRRTLGISFHVLSIVLAFGVLWALLAPGTVMSVLAALDIGPAGALVIALVVMAMLNWLGRMFKLHSVVRHVDAERRNERARCLVCGYGGRD